MGKGTDLALRAMKCPSCGKGHLARGTRLVPYTYRGQTVEVDQPGDWCDTCDEGVLSAADLAVTTKAKHDAIAFELGKKS